MGIPIVADGRPIGWLDMGNALDLDLPTLQRAMRIYAQALRVHREEIDSLNVYPVPDGDTGTNMLLTQTAVVAALEEAGGGAGAMVPGEVAETISRASLMGARGNSGVILSQVLRGIVQSMPASGSFEAGDLALGLERAAAEAYRSVARPVEGTVLSVLRDAAAEATRAAERTGATCADVLTGALDQGRASLANTRLQLAELERAGVVDAGGKGIVLLLDALRSAVTGKGPSEPVGPLGPVGAADGERPPGQLAFGYEVQFLLEAPDEAIAPLRGSLGDLGDSLVVVGGGGLFNVHVHTNEPEAAVQVGQRAGGLRDVYVASLQERVHACLAGKARAVQVAEQACAMVAVADGDGLLRTFRSLGAVVVSGGPGNNPAVAEILAAIEAAPAGRVLVLPNHPNVVPAAEQAAAAASKEAVVLSTRSIPGALAAATAFNPMRSLEDNAAAMNEGAARAAGGELVQAIRDAHTAAGPVRRGQWLGMVDGESVAVADAAADGAAALAGRLAGSGAEVVTLVVGAGAAQEERDSVEESLRRSFPGLQIEVLDGGQPLFPYLIGVE
jgi:DAK2 domain fusion protein YloV